MTGGEKLIVALDVDDISVADTLIDQIIGRVKNFKIGSQLFTRAGPQAVQMVREKGGKVFLDLKYHDIPSIVARAVAEVVQLGCWMLTLHCLGGKEMLETVVKVVRAETVHSESERPLLLGVTVLTHLQDNNLREELGIGWRLEEAVTHLALLARDAGLDGVVTSPREITIVRHACGNNFLIVTPGVRPVWALQDEQRRSLTPAEAIRAGVDYLVVGRPITTAREPLAAVEKIISEMEE